MIALGPGGFAAAPDVGPSAWLAALAGRRPLVLAPDGARGWFGGRAIVAFDPVDGGTFAGNGPEALQAAGDVLERALDAREPLLAVALLPYSGDVRWALYARGVARDARGWRWWGSEPADGWPAPPARDWTRPEPVSGPLARAVATSLDEPAYTAAVEATREAIMDGDVYVLNLTRVVVAQTDLSAPQLFGALVERAPATMAAAWMPDDGGPAILSASPERFVRLVGHEIEIAPVKGTRRRGIDAAEDAALVADLLGSEKERAEHVMVVDLERNDIGRVCVPGSVRVDPLFEIETMSYCHQAVSSVRGLVDPDASIGDVLEATFPCGSITGAPKIAAVRIAGELECGERRGYTGSLVVAVPGEIDSSVLIRTVELDSPPPQPATPPQPTPRPPQPATPATPAANLRYGTGCGITVESDAGAEWEESVLKTEPLLGDRDAIAGTPAVALRETCRVTRGAVALWPYHRARLATGGVAPELLDAIEARVVSAAAEWTDAATRRARLTVVAYPDGTSDVEVAQRLSSLDVVGGIVAARVDVEQPPPIPGRPAKPADRAYWDATHHAAEATKAHQAVLVGPHGAVIDGSTSCVWIVERGVLLTPPAPPAIPSVSCAFVLAHADRLGVPVRIEPFTWERFERADEAFFTNAFGGAAPVRGRGGPVFSAVKGLFDEVWRTPR